MADLTKVDIAGLEGNEAAQPRVFAHSAVKILDANVTGASPAGQALFTTATPSAGDTVSVLRRGACVYIGIACDITVLLEGDTETNTTTGVVTENTVTFKGCTAGSFLPILVTKIIKVGKTDGTDYAGGDVGDGTILALY